MRERREPVDRCESGIPRFSSTSHARSAPRSYERSSRGACPLTSRARYDLPGRAGGLRGPHPSPHGSAGTLPDTISSCGGAPSHSRGARLPQRLRTIPRHRDPDPLAPLADPRPHEEARLGAVALELLDVPHVHEPVPVNAHERPSERRFDRRERKVEVELPVRGVHERQPVGRLEGPDLRRLEKDEALSPPRHDARAGSPGWTRTGASRGSGGAPARPAPR